MSSKNVISPASPSPRRSSHNPGQTSQLSGTSAASSVAFPTGTMDSRLGNTPQFTSMTDDSQNLTAGLDVVADDRAAEPRGEAPAPEQSEDNGDADVGLSTARQVPLADAVSDDAVAAAAAEADDDLPGSQPDMFSTPAAADIAERVRPAADKVTAVQQPALHGSDTAGMADLQTTASETVGTTNAAAPEADVAEADETVGTTNAAAPEADVAEDVPTVAAVPLSEINFDHGDNGSNDVVDNHGSTTAHADDTPTCLPEEDPEATQAFVDDAEVTTAADDAKVTEVKSPADNSTAAAVALANKDAKVDDGDYGDETGVIAAATATTATTTTTTTTISFPSFTSADVQPPVGGLDMMDDASSSHAVCDAETAEPIDVADPADPAERSDPPGVGEQATEQEQEQNLSMNVDNLYLTQNSPVAESLDNESQAEQDATSAPASKPAAITEVDESVAVSDKSDSQHKVSCPWRVIAAAVAHLPGSCLPVCCIATASRPKVSVEYPLILFL